MEKVDIVIIGAGVVGLAIARELSSKHRAEIVLLEKHPYFGAETSSRNSEVIHAGMYYPADSLKAKFCVRGNRQLYEICEKYRIPYRKSGKLIVASSDEELVEVEALYRQGNLNGVPNLVMLNAKQIEALEPEVRARNALLSPETGSIDVHRLMQFYETQALTNGVLIAYQNTVTGIEKLANGYKISVADETGANFDILSQVVINSAGLNADKIAALVGIDIDEYHYRLHYCKGEYFNVANRHIGKIQHLIYPVPTAYSLGIHTRLRLDGTLSLGPNAYYVDEINYEVDPGHQVEFYDSVKDFLPYIQYADLTPEMAGIRPKLQGPGEKFRDFVISEERDKGLPGFVNLIGIDSPGLTSAPAIAEYVANLL
ncbi:MAG TPA: NAD(P)/FAD-dependent oxidoreductase [Candidatus Marinimicrobia bacterium]|mgnify:CR=1 FL=1|nr:NAD(P)/FAD-dependent oxidoreductase [Candidatus Neomarinimicrobiota bacterium]HRS52344.1 NAD(P)/FAD-dependent oxidoreductase [Candidatus Neomarinimicrobiota bacterium]HRU93007.1 NAD(P)/FAD-dependent oxidoreductase [Candidatus Neomarinimicrobiota bacterium]